MADNPFVLDHELSEDHILVRGIAVPKAQIDAVEQLYDAKLIKEENPRNRALILDLDKALENYVTRVGAPPEFLKHKDYPEAYFKHMPLTNSVGGLQVPLPNKPAWFKFTRKFSFQ